MQLSNKTIKANPAKTGDAKPTGLKPFYGHDCQAAKFTVLILHSLAGLGLFPSLFFLFTGEQK
jgi:hypothetical protein